MTVKKEYSLDHIQKAGEYSIYTTASALYLPKLLQAVLSSKTAVLRNFSENGLLIKPKEDLFQLIKNSGGRKVSETKNDNHIFLYEDRSYLTVDYSSLSNNISISGQTIDHKLIDMVALIKKDYLTLVKNNIVYTIIKTASGLEISNMGDGSSELIRENYRPEVLEDLDYVITAFSKSPPNGRICILSGQPGTGKTYLIRSILKQLDAMFIIVPSNLIDALDKPEFIPLLSSIKRDHQKPIILIIEDGDVCLVPRKNDNISAIASLLNLSDGILGAMIDIKMIISTNAAIKSMDEAIMRPGRLCRNICVSALDYDQANVLYQKLMKDTEANLEFRKHYTLAEVYATFNNIGMETARSFSTRQNHRAIGFSQDKDLTVNSLSDDRTIGFKIDR